MRTLKITVELTVTNVTCNVSSQQFREDLKGVVEAHLGTSELAKYLHGLGHYEDAEVVGISLSESYDTRQ